MFSSTRKFENVYTENDSFDVLTFIQFRFKLRSSRRQIFRRSFFRRTFLFIEVDSRLEVDVDSIDWLNENVSNWNTRTNSSSFNFSNVFFIQSTSFFWFDYSVFCFCLIVRFTRSTIRFEARLTFREEITTKSKRRETYKRALKSIRESKSKRDLRFVFLKRFFFFENWLLIAAMIFCKERLIEIRICSESKLESMLFSSFCDMLKLISRRRWIFKILFAAWQLWRSIISFTTNTKKLSSIIFDYLIKRIA